MTMYVLVVGPKITPPWDSAAASIGKGVLQSLAYLASHVDVATTCVELKRIIRNYGFVPSGVKDFEGFYGNKIRWHVVRHYSNQLLNEIKLTLIASMLIHNGDYDFLFYIGIPRNLLSIRLLGRACKAFILYVYTIPSIQSILALKYLTAKAQKLMSKLMIFTSSLHAYRILKTHLNLQHINVVPPVIDTSVFKPLNNISNYSSSHLRLGYVGPLHTPRFPVRDIAKVLVSLKSRGINASLHIRGLLRHGRRDRPYAYNIEKLFKRLLGEVNVDVKIGQLSRGELNEFYNSIDILLYMFSLSREAEIADPPLVPLEALSAGTPLIVSAGSSLDFYLKSLVENGFVISIKNPDNIVDAIYTLSSIDRNRYGFVTHTYIEHIFSPKSVAQRIKGILEEAEIL
ncbi:glycosyltransferase [Staphylothermus hellenicus]|uniref:Glycosyl transferase group 1 n=1 Tax=Staphylothermus hellenicus (strain DSM 12710 / JCM 10830 / BK20S6-10-b1 / P8) TaxID=591019 RepID=D7D8A7_STAHD|nr:glycosyltransferase [Staphylothermus hellenicus]ADI32003.1 glycosyl transferase group 1 [Staphylothermus hellenicus DSM 12710]